MDHFIPCLCSRIAKVVEGHPKEIIKTRKGIRQGAPNVTLVVVGTWVHGATSGCHQENSCVFSEDYPRRVFFKATRTIGYIYIYTISTCFYLFFLVHLNIRTFKYKNRYFRLPPGRFFPWPARPSKHTESNSFKHTITTMWGPPVISWFISPSNYSYKYHKL